MDRIRNEKESNKTNEGKLKKIHEEKMSKCIKDHEEIDKRFQTEINYVVDRLGLVKSDSKQKEEKMNKCIKAQFEKRN